MAFSTHSVELIARCSRVELIAHKSHRGGRSGHRSRPWQHSPQLDPVSMARASGALGPRAGVVRAVLFDSAGRCRVRAVSPAGALTLTRAAPWHGPPGGSSQLQKPVAVLDVRGLPDSAGPGGPPVTTNSSSPLFFCLVRYDSVTVSVSRVTRPLFPFRFHFALLCPRLRAEVGFNVSWTLVAPGFVPE